MRNRLALLAIILIGAAVRFVFVNQPMRYDEAVTYVEYVRPASSPLSILQTYRPNNHILHTLAVWLSTTIFGDAEWAIRLPALLAGIALIPAAYFAFREAGLLAAGLVAGSWPLIFYSVNARGYTLVSLLTLIALIAARRVLKGNRWRDWIVLTIAISLGLFTIPVMLFPAAAIFTWLGIHVRKAHVNRFGLCILVTAGLTMLLYIPTIRSAGLAEITSNKFVITHGIARFLRELRVAPIDIGNWWTTDIPLPLAIMLHLAAIAPILLAPRRILTVAIVTSLIVLFATLRMPPTRVWLWLLPLYLGSAALTLGWVMRKLSPRDIALIAIVFAAVPSSHIAISDTIRTSPDTGAFPAARGVADQLRSHLRDTDRLIASTPADGPLSYYLARLDIEPAFFDTPAPRRIFLVITDDDSIANLLARRGVNANQFNPPDLLSTVPGAKLYAAKRRGEPHSGQALLSDPRKL